MSQDAPAPAPSPRRRHPRRLGADPERIRRLFVDYRRTRDVRIRNEIVEEHLHLADHCSRRYGQHAVRDDLHQVALMAIVHAADRFDPDRGVSFRTFASRTMEGDCKRFLRDRAWNVRPPRGLLELSLAVRRQQEELSHSLGRPPGVDEVAERLGTSTDEVLEAMEAYGSRHGVSTEARTNGDTPSMVVVRAFSAADVGFDEVEDRTTVLLAVSKLDRRARELIFLRFVERRSQSELASHLGLSQSYVSRFLNSILAQMRHEIGPS